MRVDLDAIEAAIDEYGDDAIVLPKEIKAIIRFFCVVVVLTTGTTIIMRVVVGVLVGSSRSGGA